MKADGIIHKPMQGVKLWKNPKNRFMVFEAHYTADPRKRSEEFKAEKRASMPLKQFLMEYEIHWESFSGLPVYGDTWNPQIHMNHKEMIPELGLPLLIGLDFGLTPAAVCCQLSGFKLRVFWELVAVNMGIKRFLVILKSKLNNLHPNWCDPKRDFIIYIDPSGQFRKDTDENTCANEISEAGFKNIIPGAIAFEERRTSVEYFLTKLDKGQPCIEVSANNCPTLCKGFSGGYMFAEGQDEIEPSKVRPLKNQYSHVHDALQMICSRMSDFKKKSGVKIPAPQYSFGNQPRRG